MKRENIGNHLFENAECSHKCPCLHVYYLEMKLARLGYQIVKVARRVKCWVLLKNGQPIAHTSAGDESEAIQILAKRYELFSDMPSH